MVKKVKDVLEAVRKLLRTKAKGGKPSSTQMFFLILFLFKIYSRVLELFSVNPGIYTH